MSEKKSPYLYNLALSNLTSLLSEIQVATPQDIKKLAADIEGLAGRDGSQPLALVVSDFLSATAAELEAERAAIDEEERAELRSNCEERHAIHMD
jgi:hypothetical protein